MSFFNKINNISHHIGFGRTFMIFQQHW